MTYRNPFQKVTVNSNPTSDPQWSRAGTFMGTFTILAPPQARGLGSMFLRKCHQVLLLHFI